MVWQKAPLAGRSSVQPGYPVDPGEGERSPEADRLSKTTIGGRYFAEKKKKLPVAVFKRARGV